MRNHGLTVLRWGIASWLVLAVLTAAAPPGDLSRYRKFQFGMDLPTVARHAGVSTSQAKLIHSRPALVQELEWRPQPLTSGEQTEPAKEVTFTFFSGELYRIEVMYDRYEIEGMTAEDLIEGVSSKYGPAVRAVSQVKPDRSSSEQEQLIASWQDPQYRFELIRSAYTPDFKLVGVLKRLENAVQATNLEAARLDDKEAPQRELDRIAKDEAIERTKLEKARKLNRPKFRP